MTHNFSDAVREYVAGTGKKLSVQFVVAGHWRNQPCGPGGKDRKKIFIEPFWKGPERAPIASRAHRLE